MCCFSSEIIIHIFYLELPFIVKSLSIALNAVVNYENKDVSLIAFIESFSVLMLLMATHFQVNFITHIICHNACISHDSSVYTFSNCFDQVIQLSGVKKISKRSLLECVFGSFDL